MNIIEILNNHGTITISYGYKNIGIFLIFLNLLQVKISSTFLWEFFCIRKLKRSLGEKVEYWQGCISMLAKFNIEGINFSSIGG